MCITSRIEVALVWSLAAWPSASAQTAASSSADPAAAALLERARVARLRQDSALASYEATAQQRLSFSVGVKALGRERLAYRHEDAARIHWSRTGRTWIELQGSRSYVGAFSGNFGAATDRDLADFIPLPYFPGRDRLWSGDGMVTDFVGQARAAQDSVNTRELVHPLARGAETFYRFASGDSVLMTLPDGSRITLRELRITARRPQWNLIVGSFWFDDATADLVRAVYRLSAPTDILAVTKERGERDRVPRWLRAVVSPLRYDVTAISIEYGLTDQRFWLPRAQLLEGGAEAGFTHASMRIEQRFTYAAVNGAVPSQPVGEATRPVGARAAAAARARECAATGATTVAGKRYNGAVEVTTSVPCDRVALAQAQQLPASIFDAGDERLGSAARKELLDALSLGLQAAWAPQRPTFEYGLTMSRYNRVEGLSTGIGAQLLLGRGYSAGLSLSGSTADRQLNGALSLTRSNGRTTVSGAAFRRLEAMNDWGSPLTWSASVPALLFGRDDGAYFRTAGVELTGDHPRLGRLTWRVFAERQEPASVNTRWSIFGHASQTLPNPEALAGTEIGASIRLRSYSGEDPRGFRSATEVRAEGGAGRYAYARTLAELTVTHGIVGPLAAAVSAAVGATAGTVPVQRWFYLGGAPSIRGVRALSASGDAFWMARAELGANVGVVRPTAFSDLGWAGPRADWRAPGRPLAGAGLGLSVFDGLVRADFARGLHPAQQWRLDMYLDGRF